MDFREEQASNITAENPSLNNKTSNSKYISHLSKLLMLHAPTIVCGIIVGIIVSLVTAYYITPSTSNNEKNILSDLEKNLSTATTRGIILIKNGDPCSAIEICESSAKWYVASMDKVPPNRLSSEYSKLQDTMGRAYYACFKIQYNEEYLNKSLRAFNEALQIRATTRDLDYADTRDHMGDTYYELSKIRNKEKNLNEAIKNYKETLNVSAINKNTKNYINTLNNLGNAYCHLSETNKGEKNLKEAINIFEFALKICENDSIRYNSSTIGVIKNNLGIAYRLLSEVTDHDIGVDKALRNNTDAIAILENERTSLSYVRALNNKGSIYTSLQKFDSEDDYENSIEAINAFNKALLIINSSQSPLDYAEINNNIGVAYIHWSEVLSGWEKEEKLNKSLDAFEIALNIWNPNDCILYPFDYAKTINNRGIAYIKLSEVKKNKSYVDMGLKDFDEALNIIGSYPDRYADIKQNQANAYMTLYYLENNKQDLEIAIAFFKDALGKWTPDSNPIDYAYTMKYLGDINYSLSQWPSENKDKYLDLAIESYEKSLYYFKKTKCSLQAIKVNQTLYHLRNQQIEATV